MTKTVTVLSGLIRPLVENRLPGWVEPRFFQSKDEAMALAPHAEIGWFDMYDKKDMAAVITAATNLKWLNSIYAGVDGMPLDLLQRRGTVVTNGAGINAITIAEYVVMGMLTVAKGYREVVRAQDRREWLIDSPGKVELFGSRALLLGYGAIGKLIASQIGRGRSAPSGRFPRALRIAHAISAPATAHLARATAACGATARAALRR